MKQTRLYEELRELALHDATIYAFLKTQQATGASDLTVAISLIKQLSKEKKIYFDDAIRTRELSIIPIPTKLEEGS